MTNIFDHPEDFPNNRLTPLVEIPKPLVKLEFSTKELAINYAKKKKIDFEVIEPKKRKTVKKSYADNFLK